MFIYISHQTPDQDGCVAIHDIPLVSTSKYIYKIKRFTSPSMLDVPPNAAGTEPGPTKTLSQMTSHCKRRAGLQ
jgi:hypothetical protein